MSQRDRDYGARLPNQFGDGATIRIAQKLTQRHRKFADKLPGGAGDNTKLEDLSESELEVLPKAIDKEMAHTDDPDKALEIVLDHKETEGLNEYKAIKIASRNEVPLDFQALGGGFYRKGHQIWELQRLNDPDSPFRLVRKHEERHIDAMDRDLEDYTAKVAFVKTADESLLEHNCPQAQENRKKMYGMKVDTSGFIPSCPDCGMSDLSHPLGGGMWHCGSCGPGCEHDDPESQEEVKSILEHGSEDKDGSLKVGQQISTIRDGRVAQAIILLVEETDGTADIEYPDGEMEEGMPLEMLFPLDLPMMPSIDECECMEEDEDAFGPEISDKDKAKDKDKDEDAEK